MPFSKAKRAVLQSYLDDPLLIDDKKWDMRIYIAVTSVLPIRAYMHRQGFVRFASGNYTKSKGAGKTRSVVSISESSLSNEFCLAFLQIYPSIIRSSQLRHLLGTSRNFMNILDKMRMVYFQI